MMSRFLLFLLMFAFAVNAQDVMPDSEDGNESPTESKTSTIDILDESMPLGTRIAAAEVLKQKARDPDDYGSAYTLGHLYQHGPDLPGNPLSKDGVEARRLLEQAALGGRSFAFADLAELALAEGEAREAMQWTQVYLYLMTRHSGAMEDFDRRGYNADLLIRADKAWRKARLPRGRQALNALLNDYLQPHRATLVEQHVRAREEEQRASEQMTSETDIEDIELRIKHRETELHLIKGPKQGGYAVYLLEVQPSGQVSRIVTETFAPTPEHAKVLRRAVEGWEFYPHSGDGPEIARVPVQYGYTSSLTSKLKVRNKAK